MVTRIGALCALVLAAAPVHVSADPNSFVRQQLISEWLKRDAIARKGSRSDSSSSKTKKSKSMSKSSKTPEPTTASPTSSPTTAAPTMTPTTAAPTTASPTATPTTAAPSQSPTTAAPTTAFPTATPTTASPTGSPSASPSGSSKGSKSKSKTKSNTKTNKTKTAKSTKSKSKTKKSSSSVSSTSAPVTAPTAIPPSVPTTPVPVPISPDCMPTVGPCITSAPVLSNTLIAAPAGSTVAMCGGTLSIESPLSIAMDNTELCCFTSSCILQSTGDNRVLQVTGDSVTLRGMTFLNGNSNDDNGGNVAISGGGNHRIIDSSFRNGVSGDRGGNLFLEGSAMVIIEGSTFLDGMATEGGGGLAVEGLSNVEIVMSDFTGNMAPQGAGFYSTAIDPNADGQMIIIEGVTFEANAAEVGGGFLVEMLGQMPSLAILNSVFNDNTANEVAGAGAIVQFLDDLELVLSGNSGSGNMAVSLCADLLGVFEGQNLPTCIAVDGGVPDGP